jgi:hypothetical protein
MQAAGVGNRTSAWRVRDQLIERKWFEDGGGGLVRIHEDGGVGQRPARVTFPAHEAPIYSRISQEFHRGLRKVFRRIQTRCDGPGAPDRFGQLERGGDCDLPGAVLDGLTEVQAIGDFPEGGRLCDDEWLPVRRGSEGRGRTVRGVEDAAIWEKGGH